MSPLLRLTCVFAAAAALSGQSAPGLWGTFTDGANTARFAALAPNFYLDANESIHPTLGPEFRGEWKGSLQVLANGEYEFRDEVTLDGKKGKKHQLTSGQHVLQLSYVRPPGAAQLRLEWRSATFDWEPVPRSALSHSMKEHPAPAQDAELGRVLVFEARCANCHKAAGLERRVPSLTGIGSRTTQNWLFAFLETHQASPHDTVQRADLAAYLATLKSPGTIRDRRANEVAIGKGGELFGTLGCIQCHATAPQGLGSKYKLPVLADLLLRTHRPGMLLNDEDAIALAAYLTRSTNPAWERKAQDGDAAGGKQIYANAGCGGCHDQNSQARPLSELKSVECRRVTIPWPANSDQRRAVAAFLNGPHDRSPAPVYDFPLQLRRYDCLACHKPGTEAPPLEGVGEKLKTVWIGDVLWGKKRIRASREMRMPHFEEAALKPWVASFAKVEGIAPGDGAPPPAFTDAQRDTGNGLLGTNARKRGMACIGCHDWGEYKSLGEEGPQLINAAERLRFDWFERWMRNPARILSGTSMPNYFSSQPAARARETIHTLWAGMDRGAKAPVPDGYRTNDLEVTSEAKPVPTKEAIIVRWDMPEATPAAIAVGLPGKLSYCFDAAQSRVLYAWRGGFVDMTGTLLRKTDKDHLTPTAALVGDVIWRSTGFPITIGADRHPPEKRRFLGYRLIEGIPQFHYTVDGVEVWEKLTPMEGAKTIRRELIFTRVDQPLYFEGREVPRGVNVKLEATLGQ